MGFRCLSSSSYFSVFAHFLYILFIVWLRKRVKVDQINCGIYVECAEHIELACICMMVALPFISYSNMKVIYVMPSLVSFFIQVNFVFIF